MAPDPETSSFFTPDAAAGGTPDGSAWRDIRLIRESGRGWCSVYTALYNVRRVAVKALKEEYRDSTFYRQLLEKEYAIGQMMGHGNIVKMYSMESVPGLGEAILMEYVDGVSLSDYLSENPSLSDSEVDRILGEICSAVSYMHSRQVIHCDLKPNNIMLTRDGRFVKLIDFGMSCDMSFENLNPAGGTDGFTAPEVLQLEEKPSTQSDIYSIGRLIGQLDPRGKLRHVAVSCLDYDRKRRPQYVGDIPGMIARQRRKRKLRRPAVIVGAAILVAIVAIVITRHEDASPITVEPTSASLAEVKPSVETIDTISQPPMEERHADATPPEKVNPTQKSTPMPVQPEPKPAVAESPAPIISLDEQLYQKALEAAAFRFADHLQLIDTMDCVHSRELVYVKHWRWLACQDVRKWLETFLSPGNPRIESLLASAREAIVNYGEDPDHVSDEYLHLYEAISRDSTNMGCTLKYSYWRDENHLVTEEMQEDGTWITNIKYIRLEDLIHSGLMDILGDEKVGKNL